MTANTWRACSATTSPAGVGRAPALVRWTSWIPQEFSRLRMWLETEGWLMNSDFAAPENPWCSSTLSRTSN